MYCTGWTGGTGGLEAGRAAGAGRGRAGGVVRAVGVELARGVVLGRRGGMVADRAGGFGADEKTGVTGAGDRFGAVCGRGAAENVGTAEPVPETRLGALDGLA